MIAITQKLVKYNFTANVNKPSYIVIHDTGNSTAKANAEAHYKYFNGGNRNASAHYFVDDSTIMQIVKVTDGAWHCGDGGGKYGITNRNSIGIEMCINSDGNYSKTVQNTIELIAHLMKSYGIPVERVVRHYDASRKNCPQTMNGGTWSKWNEFKVKLAGASKTAASTTPTADIIQRGTVTTTTLNVRAGASTSYSIKGQLENGTSIDITGRQDDFLVVKYNGGTGYVHRDYVNITWTKPVEAPKSAPQPISQEETFYRVRKIWADASTQIGAYKVLESAKELADKHLGYSVFDDNGKALYMSARAPQVKGMESSELKVVEKVIEKIIQVPIKLDLTNEERQLLENLYSAIAKILKGVK
ncbi:MAG: putative phage related amidase [Clostridia bacterium]|jgi:N-acetylmuramoyl-L-alanine amidase CwlA|nr:putative phage related amidase [Clostridia bacterium]